MTKEQKLQFLQNRRTMYEVVLTKDGQDYLLGYTVRRSTTGLLGFCRKKVALIRAAGGYADNDVIQAHQEGRGSDARLVFRDDLIVRFSGRTARDAILAGELPRIA